MYTESEKQELEEMSEMLLDGKSIGNVERLIVNAFIEDCKERGQSLEQAIKNFMDEGRTTPH